MPGKTVKSSRVIRLGETWIEYSSLMKEDSNIFGGETMVALAFLDFVSWVEVVVAVSVILEFFSTGCMASNDIDDKAKVFVEAAAEASDMSMMHSRVMMIPDA